VTDSTFENDTTPAQNDNGLEIDANGSTDATVSVTGSTFKENDGNGFIFWSTTTGASGSNSVTFSNNTVANGAGVLLDPSGTSTTSITIDDNTITDSNANGIGIDDGATPSNAKAKITGTISGNTVGTASVANSGAGFDIGIYAEGTGSETIAITNNYTYQYTNDAGIYFLGREGSPTMNLTITGNTIADPGDFGSWGLEGGAGAVTGDGGSVCAAISGNSLAGSAASGQGGADIEVDQAEGTAFKLPGYTGGEEDTIAVQNFLAAQNTGNGTQSVIATVNGGGFVGGTSCASP
jgi:hypothetical protein